MPELSRIRPVNNNDAMNTCGRSLLLSACLALVLALTACASPKPAPKPAAATQPAGEPAAIEPSVSEAHVSYCRAYADQMAGRELQREYDSMEGRFRGGQSQVFQDFARMNAQKNYRRIYENCIRDRTATKSQDESRAK